MMFCRRALHPQPVQFYFYITPLYARQGFPWPGRIPKNIPARAASCETYSKKHTCRKCKISSNAVQRKRQNLKNASSVIAEGLFHRFAARNEEVHIWRLDNNPLLSFGKVKTPNCTWKQICTASGRQGASFQCSLAKRGVQNAPPPPRSFLQVFQILIFCLRLFLGNGQPQPVCNCQPQARGTLQD